MIVISGEGRPDSSRSSDSPASLTDSNSSLDIQGKYEFYDKIFSDNKKMFGFQIVRVVTFGPTFVSLPT